MNSFEGYLNTTVEFEKSPPPIKEDKIEFFSKSIDQEDFLECLKSLTKEEVKDPNHTVKSNNDWMAVSEQLKSVSKQLQDYERLMHSLREKEKACKEQLIALSDGVSCKGNGVKITKYFRQGTIDYKSIPELKDVDLDKYKKDPSEFWRITIEKED